MRPGLVARVGVGAASAFTPASVADLAYWFQEPTGADNTAVSSVTDRSTNGRNISQATGANQPTVQTNELNGLPGVLHDTSNDHLDLAGDLNLAKANTLFVVFKRVSSEGALLGEAATYCLYADAASVYYKPHLSATYSNGIHGGLASACIIEVRRNGTTITFKKNGTALTLGGAAYADNDLYVRSFGAAPDGSLGFNHMWYAHAAYARALSDSECSQVRSYFGTRFGITVV